MCALSGVPRHRQLEGAAATGWSAFARMACNVGQALEPAAITAFPGRAWFRGASGGMPGTPHWRGASATMQERRNPWGPAFRQTSLAAQLERLDDGAVA